MKEDPYHIEEVVKNKIWKVQYSSEYTFFTTPSGKQGAAILGIDPHSSEFKEKMEYGAAKYSKKALNLVSQDLETAQYWFSKDSIADEDVFKIPAWKLNMMVVRLNSGSLLLYAPVRILDETGLASWLDKLGQVEWVIIASSEHNASIPSVLKRYPAAQVIGSKVSEEKLNCINALPRKEFDYKCSDKKSLESANHLLRGNGVELFYISGDIATHSVFCMAHGVGLECDLVYGRAGQYNEVPEDWTDRIFLYGLIASSHNGLLPNYRIWFMDPNSLGFMMVTPPDSEGLVCREMAASLRKILSLDYDRVIPVHGPPMDSVIFRKSIDQSWNWLDGSSLLPNLN